MINSIGKWKIYALETGTFRLDGGAMMGSVPKVLWEKTNPPDKLNRIQLSLRCLLADDGQNKVLIETGIGNKINSDFINMFSIKQSQNPIEQNLLELGYNMEDINHVILTHLHFDHAGGATVFNNDGDIIPAFPNAKYYISESNWKAGLNPSPRDRASYLKENYLSLEKYGYLRKIPDNITIIEGISTLVFNGHTYGQQLVKIEDDGETLVFCSDLIPLKSHLRLPWIMGYDLNAVLTLEEKTQFLQDAACEGWWLWFYHDPKTVAVKIEKGDKYYNIVSERTKDING